MASFRHLLPHQPTTFAPHSENDISISTLPPFLANPKHQVPSHPRTFGICINNLLPTSTEPNPGKPQNNVEIASESVEPCEEYGKEIDDYLREIEGKYQVKPGYMAYQPDVNEKMRAILVDWLVDVHFKFQLIPETLYLAVNLLDRYLEKEKVVRNRLQLVGVSSMFIACKYAEIYPPEVRDLVYISDNAYTKSEIVAMEGKILTALEFNLNAPSSYRFLQRYSKFLGANVQTQYLAQYLLELGLVEYKILKYIPSIKAAAVLYLADRLLNNDTLWDVRVGERIGYDESKLKSCAKEFVLLMQLAGKGTLQAVKKKFGYSKYLSVSRLRIGKKE